MSAPTPAVVEERFAWLRRLVCALPLVLALAMLPAAESPFSIPKRALLIAAAYGAFVFAAAPGALRRLDAISMLMLAIIPASTLLAWAASSRPDLAGQTALMICAGPLLAWLTASIGRPSQKTLLLAIALSGIVEALLAIAQWSLGLDLFTPIGRTAGVAGRMRVYGTIGNPDFLAIYIAATMPAVLVLARNALGPGRWAAWAGMLLEVAALGGAGSRTGIVAAMCGCAAVLLFDRQRGLQRLRVTIVLGAIAAIAATALAWRNPRNASTAARGRMFTWKVALIDAAHRPLGDGPGTFAYFYPLKLAEYVRNRPAGDWQQFLGYERTANNDFVQAVAESGWPGLAALVAVFVLAIGRLRKMAQAADAVALPAAGVVIALGVAALAESPLQRAESWALLWLCIGIGLTNDARERDTGVTSAVWRTARMSVAAALTVVVGWIAVRPVLATHWADAGVVLESEQRYAEAVSAYRRSLAYDPSASSAAFNLPRALVHAGDVEAAIAAANDGLRWIDEPELRLLRLRILETRGSYVAALQAAADDVKRFPYSLELSEEYLHLASRLHSF